MSMQGNHMVMRSFRRDEQVINKSLARGTVRRIVRYAGRYRLAISALVVTLVLDALLTVAQPLLFRRIIDEGVTVGNSSLVTFTALLIAGVALADSLVTLVGRFFSSRIGEGLIYDLRTQVFDHVQRMPLAFFTRTQTGALVSRLNNDVIGAQQAFTSTLSGVVVQRDRRWSLTAGRDVRAVLADHPAVADPAAAVRAARPLDRPAAAGAHPGAYGARTRR